jgi:hypothetical protein
MMILVHCLPQLRATRHVTGDLKPLYKLASVSVLSTFQLAILEEVIMLVQVNP